MEKREEGLLSSKSMKHYIITRINLGYLDRFKDKADEWFDSRLTHFVDITIPSIQNQTNQKFKWLWLIDKDTKQKHVDVLTDLAMTLSNAYVIKRSCKDYIHDDKPKDLVLTTRLDSDDALASNYIELVQSTTIACKFIQPFIINFPIGLYYIRDTGRTFTGYKRFVNQFITLAEDYSPNLKTAYYDAHTRLEKHVKTIWVPTDNPMWLWTMHQNQTKNYTKTLKQYLGTLETPEEIYNFKLPKFLDRGIEK